MNIVCLTGWQQKRDALANIAPDAMHFDYASYGNVRDMYVDLPHEVDLAIGWSLGGQVLVRAVATGRIKTKRVLLLATAYQFLTDEYFPHGMALNDFNKIKNDYASNPEKMLAQFQALLAVGDKHQTLIARTLSENNGIWQNGQYWLNELSHATFANLKIADFPETMIVHGKNDKIISFHNAERLAEHLPKSRLYSLDECGHAPHMHASDYLINLINSYV